MKKQYTLGKFASGMHYIMLDEPTVKKFTKDGNKRVIAVLNDTVEIHAAILSKKEGGHFINIGSTACKKLKLKTGSTVTASFKADESELQFSVPEEFEEVLSTDAKAKKVFDQLTAGNQRSLVYLVNQVKSSDKRIERSLKIAEKLKAGVTSARVILK